MLIMVQTVEVSLSSCETLSATSFETLSHVQITCASSTELNIQNIVPIIDIIRRKADVYDVLVFSDSWLKPNINDETIKNEHLSLQDRQG